MSSLGRNAGVLALGLAFALGALPGASAPTEKDKRGKTFTDQRKADAAAKRDRKNAKRARR